MNPSSDEGLNSAFNSLVDVSNNARHYFTQGSVPDVLHFLLEVKRTAEFLEHRIQDQDRAQRSSGRTVSPQAGLAVHAKSDRQQDQSRGSFSHNSPNNNSSTNHNHSNHHFHGPPYSGPPQHLSSFKGPSSSTLLTSSTGTHGQGAYSSGSTVATTPNAAGSMPTRPGSGPTASDPHFQSPPSPASTYYQFHDQTGPDYRERPTIQTNLGQQQQQQHAGRTYGSTGRDGLEESRRYPPPPLTAPVSSSSSSSTSSLWSSPRAYVPQHAEHGSSPGGGSGTAGPFRQRHTSLPQVLNYHSPAIPSPTREQPPTPQLQFQHHSHQQQQQQYQQHSPHQHSHQPHHSSTHQQYATLQHQQAQGRSHYPSAPVSQSTFHQSSPRIQHGFEGSSSSLASPRGGYFPQDASYHHEQRPASPIRAGGRLSSDRGHLEMITMDDPAAAYGEPDDRRMRSGRRVSQPQAPLPGHGQDHHHRARIPSLVHTDDGPLSLEGTRSGLQTPPRRGSGGPAYSSLSTGMPSNINNSASLVRSSGPSLPHQQQQQQQHHQQHHQQQAGASPLTASSRSGRHSLTVSTFGTSPSNNQQPSSSAITTPTTATIATSRGDNTGSRTQFHAPLEPEVIARLDDIFFKFLQRICSDLKASDSKGDHIHQPLMAKKMQRLEASTEFRPFKFRIQAFTNAFHESLILHGLTEDILPLRKVKVYLWKHRYISRFNEDGKKQKSKGNHVWNIEARRIAPLGPPPTDSGNASSSDSTPGSASTFGPGSSGSLLPSVGTGAAVGEGGVPIRWEFREYSSRIAGQIIKFARVSIPYVYSPRIWDAQMSCPDAKFSSPWLPAWLKWRRGELKGTPGPDDESCTITVIAEYVREGEECRLEMSFPLTVSDPSKEGELMDSQNEQEQENENENDNDDEDELEEDEEDDRENHNGNGNGSSNGNKQRSTAGRKARSKQQPKKQRQRQDPLKQQQPLLVSQQQQQQQQQQHQQHQQPYSYSSHAGGTRLAATSESEENQGVHGGIGGGASSDYDEDDEDDEIDDDEMEDVSGEGEDHLSANNNDDDDDQERLRKKSQRRSFILTKESTQDPKRRKHIK